MNRRTLLGTLAALPFCGWIKPAPEQSVFVPFVSKLKGPFSKSYQDTWTAPPFHRMLVIRHSDGTYKILGD